MIKRVNNGDIVPKGEVWYVPSSTPNVGNGAFFSYGSYHGEGDGVPQGIVSVIKDATISVGTLGMIESGKYGLTVDNGQYPGVVAGSYYGSISGNGGLYKVVPTGSILTGNPSCTVLIIDGGDDIEYSDIGVGSVLDVQGNDLIANPNLHYPLKSIRFITGEGGYAPIDIENVSINEGRYTHGDSVSSVLHTYNEPGTYTALVELRYSTSYKNTAKIHGRITFNIS